jgi:hypothetical protein
MVPTSIFLEKTDRFYNQVGLILSKFELSTLCRQIFVMGIGRNVTTQDQSQRMHGEV